ncbi:hypothetical protein [Verminephrobacter aporrectodeae]|uniref:hypothetical protein n=1 Tax=Verminephrobacter aporrectodeae TaxID=1110389 RepID=UPI00223798A3|nr:hypothetical protein [Verminephrobacter aporrectodeae]
MRKNYVDKLLSSVRFDTLLQLMPEDIENAYEIFEILSPLLTRVHDVPWSKLTPLGSSWIETVNVVTRLSQCFNACTEWCEEQIDALLKVEHQNPANNSIPVERLLYLSVLSSEFRLPLVGALLHLGQHECVVRLEYVGKHIRLAHLIG